MLVSNHITQSAMRHPPEHVLRGLRRVDRLYDMHYLGAGRWAVGRVVKTAERSKIADEIVTAANRARFGLVRFYSRNRARLRLGKLAREGFGTVRIFHITGTPDMSIVTQIAEIERVYQTDREKAFEQRADISDNTLLADPQTGRLRTRSERDDEMVEEVRLRYREDEGRLFRGRIQAVIKNNPLARKVRQWAASGI